MKKWMKVLSVALIFCLFAAVGVVSMVTMVTSAEDSSVVSGTITLTTVDDDPEYLSDLVGDGTASVLDGFGGGTVTYDADTATVTMTDVTAKRIEFDMPGEFTLQVNGTNVLNNTADYATGEESNLHVVAGSMIMTGTGTLDLDAAKNAIYVPAGSFTQKGATVDISVGSYGVLLSGDATLAGGSLTIKSNGARGIQTSTGDILFSGGNVTVSGTSNLVVAAAGSVRMTAGSLTIPTSTSEVIRAYKNSLSVEGGTMTITGNTNVLITATGVPVSFSGGTVSITAKTGGCVNSGADISISQASDTNPTEITLNSPANYSLRLNTADTNFYHTGGFVTGSGVYYLYSKAASCTFNFGVDAEIDYTASTAFITNATPSIKIDEGVTFETGKELTATATHVKSVVASCIYIDTVDELLKIGTDEAYPADGSYRLNADLDLKDVDWTPLPSFSGTFDGRGHIISNMHRGTASAVYDYGSTNYNWGLFTTVTGTVKNLGFKDVFLYATGIGTGNSAVGVVCGYIQAGGLIDNVAVLSGSINATLKHQLGVGGIAGATGSSTTGWTIQNCYSAVDITATSTNKGSGSYAVAAGMIGRAWSKSGNTIKNCLNLGKIKTVDAGSISTTYSLAGNIISYQGCTSTTVSNAITRSNNFAATGLLSFEGEPAGILQDDLNKTTLVDPFGAINPASFAGLTNGATSKWTVKPAADGFYYYPMLKSFTAYSMAVDIDEDEIVAKVNELLDGLVVSNALAVADVKALLGDVVPSADITLELVKNADLESSGSFNLTIALEGGIQVNRTLTIDQLPAVTGLDYSFDSEDIGVVQGTVTVTLDQDFAAGKYDVALYWGTANDLLEGYTVLAPEAQLVADGKTLTFKTPSQLWLPPAATHLWVTIDGILVKGYEIPAERKLTLSGEKYSFGVTSDTHFYASSKPANSAAFATTLGFFEDKGASFMVVTGDFTNNGTAAQWANFTATYTDGGFKIPVFACSGNHDALEWNIDSSVTREQAIQNMYNALETYAKEDYTSDGNGNTYKVTVSDLNPMYDYTVEFNGDLFVYMGIGAYHSNFYKADGGKTNTSQHLKENQIEWLDGVLSDYYEANDGNAYLMFHYTPYENGFWTKGTGEYTYASRSWSKMVDGFHTEWNSSELLYNVLSKYPKLIHFSGHTHTALNSFNTISTTRRNVLVDDSAYDVVYQAVNDPLGYTAINTPSSQDNNGFYVSVYNSGILLTGYNTQTGEVYSNATFFIPNEDDDSNVGSEGKDLSVNFTETTPAGKVYSLDMIWENSDFAFDYVGGTQGAWNPDNHTYGETSDAGWTDRDLKVTVINHSNAAVKVTMAITDGDATDSLTVTADKTTETLATAEGTTVENAPQTAFTLTISGTPTADVTKVATATLTFEAVG